MKKPNSNVLVSQTRKRAEVKWGQPVLRWVWYPIALVASIEAWIRNKPLVFLKALCGFILGKVSFRKGYLITLWNMGRNPGHSSSFLVDRFSPICKDSKLYAASWKVLELFYNWHADSANDLIEKFWLGNTPIRAGVAERKDLVRDIIIGKVKEFSLASEGSALRILSIACGSTRSISEALKATAEFRVNVEVYGIDIDESALEYSDTILDGDGQSCFIPLKMSYNRGIKKLQEQGIDFDIIEVVGFLDYLSLQKAQVLLEKLFSSLLKEDGILIGANVRKSCSTVVDKIFLDNVLLWPMYWRTDKEIDRLLSSYEQVRSEKELTGRFTVFVITK